MTENDTSRLSAQVLGQLMLMQSIIYTLPDEQSIFHFVCHGLRDVPGVSEVSCPDSNNECWGEPFFRCAISTSSSVERKDLSIYVSEPDLFAPYESYIRNFCFMLEVILDERSQRRQNEVNQRLLIIQSRHAAMGEMISNIAHQWRQPLNMLGLLSQELLMTHRAGRFSQELIEANVKKIMEIIHFMSKTIDDFTSFVRTDKKKEIFSVRAVVEKTLSLLEPTLAAQKIRTKIEATGDPVIEGYPNEYSQVIFNIISNARDAFFARRVASPVVTVAIRNQEGRTVVTVTDNAGGIPEQIIEKVFEPYFTTKGPSHGTGIGLFMCKMIIENNMDGTISVSNVSGGAEFRIVV
jgi:signal transduction histidine kinase